MYNFQVAQTKLSQVTNIADYKLLVRFEGISVSLFAKYESLSDIRRIHTCLRADVSYFL